MGADEEGTHERLNGHRRATVDPKIAENHGRIVKSTGDGLLFNVVHHGVSNRNIKTVATCSRIFWYERRISIRR
jgi:hypothetical protein